jgi:adenosylcobinamide-GDP ribazoletransferase
MATGGQSGGFGNSLKAGLAFSTRLPIVGAAGVAGTDVAKASWTFPIVGALIGALGASVYFAADAIGLDPFICGTLALAATVLLTGALHEDGLADTADGFGGGATKERKLEIMRDSRIGAYGAAALALSLMLRAGIVASLADPVVVAQGLIAAHAGARATLPIFMRLVPRARQDGLAAGAGRPPLAAVIAGAILGVIALGLGLGPSGALVALLLLALIVGLMAWLCLRQIGGQTGDVLGALEQLSEILILLTAAVWL